MSLSHGRKVGNTVSELLCVAYYVLLMWLCVFFCLAPKVEQSWEPEGPTASASHIYLQERRKILQTLHWGVPQVISHHAACKFCFEFSPSVCICVCITVMKIILGHDVWKQLTEYIYIHFLICQFSCTLK